MRVSEKKVKARLPFPAAPVVSTRRGTFESLTAMRGVAALLVAFFHLRWGIVGVPIFDAWVFSFRFGNRGYLWVDFFFILSGFILAYRYGESCARLNCRGYGHFVWQRVARIWPLHLATMGIAIGYLTAKHGPGYVTRPAVTANLLLVHSWGYYFRPPLDFPSWSLSCEWGAYLLLPLYLFITCPVRRSLPHVFLVAGLFALLVGYAMAFRKGTLDLMREQWGLGRCLIEVAIGVSLFRVHDSLRGWKISRHKMVARRVTLGFDIVAAVIFCAIFVVFTYTKSDLWFVPLAGGLILALSLAEGPFSGLLQVRPMVLLGEISFSIYMLHAFVYWLCQDLLANVRSQISVWGGAVCLVGEHLLVIGLSYLSFKLIERPAHRLLTGR
jgi:peptidoglycan/LPS O-acetylase OafA/YrhL